jgi:hypothetical protein
MQTIRDNYLTAYRNLKLTRDAEGVLVVNSITTKDRSHSRQRPIQRLSMPSTEFHKIERIRS